MNEINLNISDAEWIVIKILWEKSPLTSTDIIEALSPQTNWSPKTIHSLISRLVKKGAVGVNKDCSQFQFFPLVEKKDCVMKETRSFIKKVYDGSLKLMVTNFIKDEKLSKDEIEDLQRLLNEKMKKK
ncbi:MAG: BlaI/MecI/CopY family transcriptional regulator [Clostridium sp.]|uniref:BlaI/MecI/CopY family transcriptional regulator n=1 Tax=Clostridium sp. TaxID=1506 RepID=UPI003D6C8B4E